MSELVERKLTQWHDRSAPPNAASARCRWRPNCWKTRCSASVQTIQSDCLAATTGRIAARRDSALLAGGGLRCCKVLGSIPARRDWGEQPKTRPIHFRDVFATLYERLGIDVATTQFTDLAGRPNTSSATTDRVRDLRGGVVLLRDRVGEQRQPA